MPNILWGKWSWGIELWHLNTTRCWDGAIKKVCPCYKNGPKRSHVPIRSNITKGLSREVLMLDGFLKFASVGVKLYFGFVQWNLNNKTQDNKSTLIRGIILKYHWFCIIHIHLLLQTSIWNQPLQWVFFDHPPRETFYRGSTVFH